MDHPIQPFLGFEPLTANYVYCPNQFFDVCLPNCSRPVIRIVAYILRQTLGWLDEQGNPRQQDIQVSFRDFVEKASVSRGAIGPAVKEAIAAGFVTCQQDAMCKSRGNAGQSAAYSLRWDTGAEYTTRIDSFAGFFAGEGNRTPVPNRFFDTVICNESLSVTKVVGTVIRQTLGYQNQFGGRRTSHPLSYSSIQRYANMRDRSTLSQALRVAKKTGYIECVETGEFTPDHRQQRTASYGVRWHQRAEYLTIGSKTRPENDRFRNPTSNGSKTRPEDRFKNPTSKKKTVQNNNERQQTAAELKAVELLTDQGLDKDTAAKLVKKRGIAVVERQVEWLDDRNPRESRIGMLRKAIDEDWPKPAAVELRERRTAQRQRQSQRDERQLQEDSAVATIKRKRAARKQRLLNEWKTASHEDRRSWIRDAVRAEASRTIADLIRRQKPDISTPHIHILEVIARERNLPPILTLRK